MATEEELAATSRQALSAQIIANCYVKDLGCRAAAIHFAANLAKVSKTITAAAAATRKARALMWVSPPRVATPNYSGALATNPTAATAVVATATARQPSHAAVRSEEARRSVYAMNLEAATTTANAAVELVSAPALNHQTPFTFTFPM